jgi:hypothetical protein
MSSRGWPPQFPVAQWPNPPLWVALAAMVATRVLDNEPKHAAQAVFYLALGIWAYLELTEGVNWFRRALGAAFLIYLVVRLATAL